MNYFDKLKIGAIITASLFSLTSNAESEEIVIALVGPVTGSVSQYGTMQNNGAAVAADLLNTKGGMNTKVIKPKIYDDACDPKQAVSVANQIVNDKVKFVVGHLCSTSTLSAAEIYEKEGIVMVSPGSTTPELSDKGYKYIFRTIGTDSQNAQVSAKYIVDNLKPKKIAVIHDNSQYGQNLAEELIKNLKENKIEPAIFEGIKKGQSDFSDLITKLKKEEVDFVYWGGYYPELGLIIRQAAAQEFKPQYMGADGVDNQDIFAIAGEDADGLLVTVAKNFAEDEKNKDLMEAFFAKNQDPHGQFVFTSYAALQAIADAANIAKSNEPEKVAEVLHKETFNTPIGSISFSENGDLKEFKSVIYSLKANGTKELKTTE